MASYTHLSPEERDRIAVLRGQGKSFGVIGMELGRSPSSIWRELRRNAPPIHRGYYLPHKAQAHAEERWCTSHRRARLKSARIRRYTVRQLKRGWPPELVAGRWTELHPEEPISHEAVYQWIYTERRDLVPFLHRAHRRRKRRGYSRKHKTAHIPNRTPIAARPSSANNRREIGHWESDTVQSRRSKTGLVIAADRKSRITKVRRVERRTAKAVRVALNRSLCRSRASARRSITYDNGPENVEHEVVNAVLGTASYFCEPYRSWEKGTVEHTIGLIRRFLPKGTDFATISPMEIKRIERWLNNRPRKCLDFRTPAEVFRSECCT
jgi:IS30 family transposase